MVDKEICRFKYEDIEYQISHLIFQYGNIKISMPSILITTKSSNSKRSTYVSKTDGHYNLVGLNNPIKLIRKISNIYNDELKSFDYVCFSAHTDATDKCTEVYGGILNKMGFVKLLNNKYYHFYSRKDKKLKRKEVVKIFKDFEIYLH